MPERRTVAAKGISRGETECISGTGWPKCTDEGRRANVGDSSWFSKLGGLSSIGSVVSVIPVLSVLYLLGIVISNVAYLLSKKLEEGLRETKLSDINREYEEIRNALYTSAHKDLIEEFEFRRSKIRICRGWFINSILIIIALTTYLWTGKIAYSIVWFWIITVGLLMVGTGVSWWTATDTELGWLNTYAKQRNEE